MTFQQLAYIVEISKCGSINKAAQNLYLSQSALSTSVRALEEEMGIPFFIRSQRGVEFTHAGKEFVSYAISLLEQKQRIESLYKENSGSLNAANFFVSTQRFSFVQDAFLAMLNAEKERNFCFGYREDSMDAVIEDVYNHRADIGIISLSPFTETLITHLLNLRGLAFHEIAQMTPSIFCRSTHPLACKEVVTEDDLAAYPYICFEQRLGAAAEFSEEYQPRSFRKPAQTICTNNRATVNDLLTETDGFTIGSGLLTKSQPTLISIPLADAAVIRLGWIAPTVGAVPQQTTEFVSLLEQTLSSALEMTKEIRSARRS